MTLGIVAGGIDLSVGSIVALCTVVIALRCARTITRRGGPAECGSGGLRLDQRPARHRPRVIPFIVTLGMMILVAAPPGLADERRIEAPNTWLNDLLRTVDAGRWILVPSGIWLVVALRSSRPASSVHTFRPPSVFRSVRTSARHGCAAWRQSHKIAVYTIAAALAGVGGVLMFPGCRSRSDHRGGPRARRDCRRHHRRRSLSWRTWHGARHRLGAPTMAVIQIGCAQRGLPNWVRRSDRCHHRPGRPLDRGEGLGNDRP